MATSKIEKFCLPLMHDKQTILSVSIAANGTANATPSNLSIDGYKPVFFTIEKGAFGDYLSFHASASKISGNKIEFGLISMKSNYGQTVTFQLNCYSLWEKVGGGKQTFAPCNVAQVAA